MRRRAYIFNMMILLLPTLNVEGVLAASGDTSDGLKLLFLSLLGCGLIYQAIKQSHQLLLKWLAIVWWWKPPHAPHRRLESVGGYAPPT